VILRQNLLPKSLVCLREYSGRQLLHDAAAGVTVGLVALPLAMAFAIASGVAPIAGLSCAIVAGFLISALGGSRTQIGGPTGAFVVVVSGIVARYGLDGLMTCTLLAGILLILLGVTGMGTVIQFIPRPVVIGFTNGIAVLIASTQIKDFFGLQIPEVPGEFLSRARVLAAHWSTLDSTTAAIAGCSLAAIVALRRIDNRIPGTVMVLIGATATAWWLGFSVETIQTRFGGLPAGLPRIQFPSIRPDLILTLLSPAITVAMLGAIESLLSAVVADRMTGDKHNPNMELVAQGVANVASPLFGGLPATGAIARTATNIRSGAGTPVAGMIHALTLLLVLVFAAPLAGHIPLSVLAAILMTVAYNMGEWREIPGIVRLGLSSSLVWLITFTLTVLADLTVAVEAGMILAALMFIRKVSLTTTVARVTSRYIDEGRKHSLQLHDIPEGVAIYRIHGPFLFGATEKLAAIEHEMDALPQVVILRLRNMTALDSTGLHALESIAGKLRRSGRAVILCGIRAQPRRIMARAAATFHEHVPPENVCPSIEAALKRARKILSDVAAVRT
jgi:sulfate permease, SulP family